MHVALPALRPLKDAEIEAAWFVALCTLAGALAGIAGALADRRTHRCCTVEVRP